MKTIIGINTLTAVEQIAYSNHIQFFHRLGRHHPNDDFAISTPRRMGIDRMRNMTAKVALINNFDYLMFIDDDVIVPLDCFEKLLAADKDIVAAWTIIRGWPFENMFFRYDGVEGQKNLKSVKDVKRNGGIIDVDAVGFSCVLIKMELLKKIPPPWFVTGPSNTEDIYFCVKARIEVPECTIAVDTDLETAHILGPEVIAPWNLESYSNYFKETFPSEAGLESSNESNCITKPVDKLTYEQVLSDELGLTK